MNGIGRSWPAMKDLCPEQEAFYRDLHQHPNYPTPSTASTASTVTAGMVLVHMG